VSFCLNALKSQELTNLIINYPPNLILDAHDILMFFAMPVTKLILGVLIGIFSYSAILAILWRLRSQSSGAEVRVINYVFTSLGRSKVQNSTGQTK
jgi:hypothetical protein